jgi:hypothetical protein
MPPQLAHYRHLTHGRVFGPVEGSFRELREDHRLLGPYSIFGRAETAGSVA